MLVIYMVNHSVYLPKKKVKENAFFENNNICPFRNLTSNLCLSMDQISSMEKNIWHKVIN